MIVWLNGAFGAGKTTCAFELHKRLPNSFVYDPENIGYFIRRNTPKEVHRIDFQDHEQWRSFNLEMLRLLHKEYMGTLIVPMTLVNRSYYDEIIGVLVNSGVPLKHFILHAERATLHKRLSFRLERGDTWAKAQVDRCLAAFAHDITEEKIITDGQSVDAVVREIATRSNLTLLPDNRGAGRKLWDRTLALLHHIRR